MRLTRITAPIAFLLVAGVPAAALAWDPFLSENSNVARGNARLAANDPTGALAAYDDAARELPSEPRIPLNRGLALMASKQLALAREAFQRASDPPAPPEVRADAFYDSGLASYREADEAATQQNHEAAQQGFRAAADAFRRSLRVRPGNRDAAWNLELALRRLRESEQEQQQQEEQERQQQAQNQQQQQDQQQQQQDQQQQDQQQQDQQQQDQQAQNQQQDQQQQDQQQQDQQQPGNDQQDQQQAQNQQQQDQQQQQAQNQQSQQQEGQRGQEPQPGEEGPTGQELPEHVARVLDSLQDGEQNLERLRARIRAARERRAPSKDW